MTTADVELVRALKSGDDRAFRLLVDKHRPAMLGQCRRAQLSGDEAEDIVQDALLVAHEKIETFVEGRSLLGWLLRITINRILQFKKKRDVDLAALHRLQATVAHRRQPCVKSTAPPESTFDWSRTFRRIVDVQVVVLWSGAVAARVRCNCGADLEARASVVSDAIGAAQTFLAEHASCVESQPAPYDEQERATIHETNPIVRRFK